MMHGTTNIKFSCTYYNRQVNGTENTVISLLAQGIKINRETMSKLPSAVKK